MRIDAEQNKARKEPESASIINYSFIQCMYRSVQQLVQVVPSLFVRAQRIRKEKIRKSGHWSSAGPADVAKLMSLDAPSDRANALRDQYF